MSGPLDRVDIQFRTDTIPNLARSLVIAGAVLPEGKPVLVPMNRAVALSLGRALEGFVKMEDVITRMRADCDAQLRDLAEQLEAEKLKAGQRSNGFERFLRDPSIALICIWLALVCVALIAVSVAAP